MSKKKKKKKARQQERTREQDKTATNAAETAPLEAEAISLRGKKTIAAGVGVLILGFVILTMTDPEGRNWASHLSPLLILGAYAVIAVGIFLPDEDPAPEKDEKEDNPPVSAPSEP